MAENYEIVGVIVSQRLTSSGGVEDVIEATAVTKPNSVTFTVSVVKAPGWREELAAAAEAEAAELQGVFEL